LEEEYHDGFSAWIWKWRYETEMTLEAGFGTNKEVSGWWMADWFSSWLVGKIKS